MLPKVLLKNQVIGWTCNVPHGTGVTNIRGNMECEVLSLHLEKGTMRVRWICDRPSDLYKLGEKVVFNTDIQPFLDQYKIVTA